jgi:hypothetical protein
LDFQKNIALLVAITAIFSGLAKFLVLILLLQLQRKKREEIMVTEETMETMREEVEINLDRTQDLWATPDQNYQ